MPITELRKPGQMDETRFAQVDLTTCPEAVQIGTQASLPPNPQLLIMWLYVLKKYIWGLANYGPQATCFCSKVSLEHKPHTFTYVWSTAPFVVQCQT